MKNWLFFSVMACYGISQENQASCRTITQAIDDKTDRWILPMTSRIHWPKSKGNWLLLCSDYTRCYYSQSQDAIFYESLIAVHRQQSSPMTETVSETLFLYTPWPLVLVIHYQQFHFWLLDRGVTLQTCPNTTIAYSTSRSATVIFLLCPFIKYVQRMFWSGLRALRLLSWFSTTSSDRFSLILNLTIFGQTFRMFANIYEYIITEMPFPCNTGTLQVGRGT